MLSRLGVAGTILGAAVAPLIIALAHDRRRRLDPERRPRLTAGLATAAATIGILVAGITFAEAVTDEPISDWGRDGGSGSRSGDQAPAHESATPPDGPSTSPTAASSPAAVP